MAVNNTFHNCNLAVHLDNRGMNWEAGECTPVTGEAYAGVMAVVNGSNGDEWLSRFPEMMSIVKHDHLCIPVYNRVIGNQYSDVKTFIDASPQNCQDWLVTVDGNTNVTTVGGN